MKTFVWVARVVLMLAGIASLVMALYSDDRHVLYTQGMLCLIFAEVWGARYAN